MMANPFAEFWKLIKVAKGSYEKKSVLLAQVKSEAQSEDIVLREALVQSEKQLKGILDEFGRNVWVLKESNF